MAVQPVRQLVALASSLVLDLLIVLLASLVVAVILTGGGASTIYGIHVSVHSVANPLAILCCLVLLRLSIRAVPFLGSSRLPLQGIDDRALQACRRAFDTLTGLTRPRAGRRVAGIIGLVTVAKLANAYFYPGFFSGDDVEIHEMTFARLFHLDWQPWNLRSPFYPLVFIYPAQAALVWLGRTDAATLVFAGRAVVALLSSIAIWLTYRAGWRLGGPAVAVTAAGILALHRLHVTFGGSELPRPVATVFVLAAYLLIVSKRVEAVSAMGVGCLLGIAASCRFSELVFLLPALAQLALARRYRDAAIVAVSFACTLAIILGLGDLLFWGSPFFSLANVFDYTVVYRMSSRGYEPFHYYLTVLHAWTTAPVALLALYGLKAGDWRVGLWWLIPIAALSTLPHKEPRYLLPILPFVALSAAQGLEHVLRKLSTARGKVFAVRQEAAAVVLIVVCAGAVLFEIGGWRFRKSSDGVVVARAIAARGCQGAVAIERLWRAGGRLYLRACRDVRDVDPETARDAEAIASIATARDVEWLVLRNPVDDDSHTVIRGAGFRPEAFPGAEEYVVFRRSSGRLLEQGDLPGVIHVVLHEAVEQLVIRSAGAERTVARVVRRIEQRALGECTDGVDQIALSRFEPLDRLAPPLVGWIAHNRPVTLLGLARRCA